MKTKHTFKSIGIAIGAAGLLAGTVFGASAQIPFFQPTPIQTLDLNSNGTAVGTVPTLDPSNLSGVGGYDPSTSTGEIYTNVPPGASVYGDGYYQGFGAPGFDPVLPNQDYVPYGYNDPGLTVIDGTGVRLADGSYASAPGTYDALGNFIPADTSANDGGTQSASNSRSNGARITFPFDQSFRSNGRHSYPLLARRVDTSSVGIAWQIDMSNIRRMRISLLDRSHRTILRRTLTSAPAELSFTSAPNARYARALVTYRTGGTRSYTTTIR